MISAETFQILKEASAENSGLSDEEHGLPIFITVSCRKYFREAYPTYAKIRNHIMNEFIAKMFSKGRIVDYFRPKKGTPNEVGEVREVSGGKFIAIIGTDNVRVIAVKGSPAGLPSLPQDKVPAPIQTSERVPGLSGKPETALNEALGG